MSFARSDMRGLLFRFLPTLVLAGLGLVAALVLIPWEVREVADHLAGYPDSHAAAHLARPFVLGALCFVPAIAAFGYALGSSLDRYVLRAFLTYLAITLFAVVAIWVLLDLSGKLDDFLESDQGIGLILKYYAALLPQIFVEHVAFALLLALLFSLGNLSRHQEIVSMIQTGRGVGRLIAPLLGYGLLTSLLCLGLNYQWAPSGGRYKEALLSQIRRGTASLASDVVYFEPDSRRLWFIANFPYRFHQGEPLEGVIVRLPNAADPTQDRIIRAKRAYWERGSGTWTFEEGTIEHPNRTLSVSGELQPFGQKDLVVENAVPFPKVDPLDNPLQFTGWSETPWLLVKPGLQAANLGIPGLYSWLLVNQDSPWADQRRFWTQYHYRFAQPWICLAAVALAAPLGIVFTRRSGASGVAVAIFLVAGLLFLSEVFLALGESGYLPPVWAAWGTNLIALVIALYLTNRRLIGRPIYATLKGLLPD